MTQLWLFTCVDRFGTIIPLWQFLKVIFSVIMSFKFQLEKTRKIIRAFRSKLQINTISVLARLTQVIGTFFITYCANFISCKWPSGHTSISFVFD